MVEGSAVFFRICGMLLVMAVGWIAARRRYLAPGVTQILGRLVVDISFPALVFVQMLKTIDPAALRANAWVPVLAVGTLAVGQGVGLLAARVFSRCAEPRSFAFLVSMPNWIFLPLPIADALYGGAGVRFVLLYNVGAQLMLWTTVPALLQGRWGRAEGLKALLTNPGVIATVGGIVVALLWPDARQWAQAVPREGPLIGRMVGALLDGLGLVGSLTIPLSLVVTGAQMGELTSGQARGNPRVLTLLAARLLIAPCVTLSLVLLGSRVVGVAMSPDSWVVLTIIVAMPVAVSCGMFIERYGGDRVLSALGIVYTTVLSTVTVPLLVLVWRALGP